jgi:hypothetical protein
MASNLERIRKLTAKGVVPVDSLPLEVPQTISVPEARPAKPKGPAYTPPKKGKKKRRKVYLKTRLPIGSKFELEYVAEELWKGTLKVPDCPLFGGQASGIFKCLDKIDDYYRVHKEEVDKQKPAG